MVFISQLLKKSFFIIFILILNGWTFVYASTKTTITTGLWNNPSNWLPAGIPSSADNVIIQPNHVITIDNAAQANSITVNTNAELNISAGKAITIHGSLTVNGKLAMNGGDINFLSVADFNIGTNAIFSWEPFNNSQSGASLFLNSIEHFDANSTLIIKKWYDYATVPLGNVVTGNFGNLKLNTLSNNFLFEWNQNNQFETHKILGTLTIEQGWIVLDKSGSISNTTIGKINLATPNAYLDFHNGTHPGSFTLNTTSISNIGGTLNGIYNGNGNITLNVAENFDNLGNVVLIYNTGIFGVGNGNATMNVIGNYNQSFGDFRAIFNLTTLTAGISSLTFNNLNLTGGIMMGHYACHTSSGQCNFKVNGNLNINFSSATDKFRVAGLTSLSGTFNNTKSNLIVIGNLIVSGNTLAEFTSSGSIGAEAVSITGNTTISGGTNNFNMGSHQITFNNSGDLNVISGNVSLSKSPGNATITIGGNFYQSSGIISFKGNTGTADATIKGNFNLYNGSCFLRSNTNTASSNPVSITIQGNFNHSGGTINYDDNVLSTATNTIIIKGSQFNLDGNGLITHAGSGTLNVFGILNYNTNGAIAFRRNSTSHIIQQVKQIISSGCTLDVISGNFQIASHSTASFDYLKVMPGGVLKMNSQKIISNSLAANSGITIENDASLSLQHINGLYNGSENACISSTGNMNYFLAPTSIIEYNGTESQVVTGIGVGKAVTNNHKYGILKINFQGVQNVENVYLTTNNVAVRYSLILTKGEFKLNNYTLTIESGSPTAVSRMDGYIKSENTIANNQSIVKWMNLSAGEHVFPFGVSSREFIPFTFIPVTGIGGTVSIATRSTGSDNLPYPNGGTLSPVTDLKRNGIEISKSSIIDRWFDIVAIGFKANIIASYRGIENTLADSLVDATLSFQFWDQNKWSPSFGNGIGVRNGIGIVSANNVTSFSHWIISTPVTRTSTSDIINFFASLIENNVNLNWSVNSAVPVNNFIIEQSQDQINFSEVGKIDGNTTIGETIQYSFIDHAPSSGISYYRIKQVNADNKISYSDIKMINNSTSMQDFSIISIFPNPFIDHITISFVSSNQNPTELIISSANGKIIHQEQIPTVEGKNNFEYLEKKNLPKGIYVVTLRNGGTLVSKKLFKS